MYGAVTLEVNTLFPCSKWAVFVECQSSYSLAQQSFELRIVTVKGVSWWGQTAAQAPIQSAANTRVCRVPRTAPTQDREPSAKLSRHRLNLEYWNFC